MLCWVNNYSYIKRWLDGNSDHTPHSDCCQLRNNFVSFGISEERRKSSFIRSSSSIV